CVAHIKTHSNHATSIETKLALQLVAFAAPDASQECFVCTKNQENSNLLEICMCSVCDDSCSVAHIKTHSNHATSIEIKLELQLVAFAAPDASQEFFSTKNQENSNWLEICACSVCDDSCSVAR